MLEKSLQNNIWKFTVMLISNKRIFVAILGAYYLTVPGVTPAVIGTILLISTFAGFLLEIPSGYVSDKLGHKQALVTARVMMIISTSLYIFANDEIFLILAGIFLSISQAFNSGTASAFLHETLRALNQEDNYTNVMGKARSIGFAVPIALMVLVPFFVSISYKAPFVLALVIDIIGFFAVASLVVPPVTQEHIDEVGVTNFKQVMLEGYRFNYLGIAIFTGIVSGVLFSTGIYRAVYQVFFRSSNYLVRSVFWSW
ncbi:MFS transporter [Candidatus Nomurabacteria bacterium]|nr:MFS transporter [Candidatus Kaiserbacteria bacterium]MCB9813834.1 MFS transporter [Candidatus Nomurabacteria bacterium]